MLKREEIKQIRQLADAKYRSQTHLFVAEGVKTVSELAGSGIETIAVYCTEAQMHQPWLKSFGNRLRVIPERQMNQISQMQTPPGILAICRIPHHRFRAEELENELSLVLDGIADPGNLGTIIRSAEWFGVNLIFCSDNSADPWQHKVVQSAMGSLFRTRVVRTNLFDLLYVAKERNVLIYGAVVNGKSLYEVPIKNQSSMLVIGSESHGISPEIEMLLDMRITIPKVTNSLTESLNAGVAAAILLNEFKRPKQKTK